MACERKEEKEEEDARWHISERRWGSCSRSVRLPRAAGCENIKAEYDAGVLKVKRMRGKKAEREGGKKGERQDEAFDSHTTFEFFPPIPSFPPSRSTCLRRRRARPARPFVWSREENERREREREGRERKREGEGEGAGGREKKNLRVPSPESVQCKTRGLDL